jgi:hypothetical protein
MDMACGTLVVSDWGATGRGERVGWGEWPGGWRGLNRGGRDGLRMRGELSGRTGCSNGGGVFFQVI